MANNEITIKDAKLAASLIRILKNEVEKESGNLRKFFVEELHKVELKEGPSGPPGERGGPPGPPGEQGRGIHEAKLLENKLFVTYTDDKKQLIGELVAPPGPRGRTGAQGHQGDLGPIGPVGPIGKRGPIGIQGIKGDLGPIGPIGPIGPLGPEGPRGGLGERGIQGDKGDKGDPGERGPQGIQGLFGEKGDPGDPGKDANIEDIEKRIETIKKTFETRISAINYNKVMGQSPGSGEVWLKNLDDIDYYTVGSASDGQALVWSASRQKWQANTVSGGTGSVASRSVTISFPTASEDLTLFHTDAAATLSGVDSVMRNNTPSDVTFTIKYGADRTTGGTEIKTGGLNCSSNTVANSVISFDNATIPANSFVWLETSLINGGVQEFHLSLQFA